MYSEHINITTVFANDEIRHRILLLIHTDRDFWLLLCLFSYADAAGDEYKYTGNNEAMTLQDNLVMRLFQGIFFVLYCWLGTEKKNTMPLDTSFVQSEM